MRSTFAAGMLAATTIVLPALAAPIGSFEVQQRVGMLENFRNGESVGRSREEVNIRLDTRTGQVSMCLWGRAAGHPVELPNCVRLRPMAMGATTVGRFRLVALPHDAIQNHDSVRPAEFIFIDSTEPTRTFVCEARATRIEPLPRVLIDSLCHTATTN
jgi:hypothetical protein